MKKRGKEIGFSICVNYAWYGLCYLQSMLRLHPTLLKSLWVVIMSCTHQNGFHMLFGQISLSRQNTRHGPAGIVGFTMNESTLAIQALSHSTCAQLMSEPEAMRDGEEQNVVTSHQEERHTQIKADDANINSYAVEGDKYQSAVLQTYFPAQLLMLQQ